MYVHAGSVAHCLLQRLIDYIRYYYRNTCACHWSSKGVERNTCHTHGQRAFTTQGGMRLATDCDTGAGSACKSLHKCTQNVNDACSCCLQVHSALPVHIDQLRYGTGRTTTRW